MKILFGIIVGLAFGIAAVQIGALVVGPLADFALTAVCAALLLVASIAAFFLLLRKPILNRLGMKVDARLQDIQIPAAAIVEALDRKATAAAIVASIELSTILISWQSQVRSRQLIVTTLTALLAVFAAILGSSLLVKQNDLLENQNKLLTNQTNLMAQQGQTQQRLLQQQNRSIEDQTRATRAQATAVLLSGFTESRKLTEAQASLLLAFPDVGFDALINLAQGTGGDRKVAQDVLVNASNRLTTAQAMTALPMLLHEDAERATDYNRPPGTLAGAEELEAMLRGTTIGDFLDDGHKARIQALQQNLIRAGWKRLTEVDGLTQGGPSGFFVDRRDNIHDELKAVPAADRYSLWFDVTEYYMESELASVYGGWRSHQASSVFERMCGLRLNTLSFNLRTWLMSIPESDRDIELYDAIYVYLWRTCFDDDRYPLVGKYVNRLDTLLKNHSK